MKITELLPWLKELGINLVGRDDQEGGEVLIFSGTRPFPYDNRPRWVTLAVKDGQQTVAKREIQALLRHFCHGEAVFPKAMVRAAAAGIAVQPIHAQPEIERKN
jgi:hypothetical protein